MSESTQPNPRPRTVQGPDSQQYIAGLEHFVPGRETPSSTAQLDVKGDQVYLGTENQISANEDRLSPYLNEATKAPRIASSFDRPSAQTPDSYQGRPDALRTGNYLATEHQVPAREQVTANNKTKFQPSIGVGETGQKKPQSSFSPDKAESPNDSKELEAPMPLALGPGEDGENDDFIEATRFDPSPSTSEAQESLVDKYGPELMAAHQALAAEKPEFASEEYERLNRDYVDRFNDWVSQHPELTEGQVHTAAQELNDLLAHSFGANDSPEPIQDFPSDLGEADPSDHGRWRRVSRAMRWAKQALRNPIQYTGARVGSAVAVVGGKAARIREFYGDEEKGSRRKVVTAVVGVAAVAAAVVIAPHVHDMLRTAHQAAQPKSGPGNKKDITDFLTPHNPTGVHTDTTTPHGLLSRIGNQLGSAAQHATEKVTLHVPKGEGFDTALQHQYHLSPAEAHRAYAAMRPHLSQVGTYSQDGGFRVSSPGDLVLNEQASSALKNVLAGLGKL